MSECECFLPFVQVSSAAGKRTQKRTQEESDSEESLGPGPDEDDEDEHAEEHPPSPATASWSSDHNYIAVTPEKTTPISPTVLNKKCMYLFEGLQLLLKSPFFPFYTYLYVFPVTLTSPRNDFFFLRFAGEKTHELNCTLRSLFEVL